MPKHAGEGISNKDKTGVILSSSQPPSTETAEHLSNSLAPLDARSVTGALDCAQNPQVFLFQLLKVIVELFVPWV